MKKEKLGSYFNLLFVVFLCVGGVCRAVLLLTLLMLDPISVAASNMVTLGLNIMLWPATSLQLCFILANVPGSKRLC